MSELLWPLYHEMKARLDALEAWLNREHPDWNNPTPPDEPSAPANYSEPTQTDVQDDSATSDE